MSFKITKHCIKVRRSLTISSCKSALNYRIVRENAISRFKFVVNNAQMQEVTFRIVRGNAILGFKYVNNACS